MACKLLAAAALVAPAVADFAAPNNYAEGLEYNSATGELFTASIATGYLTSESGVTMGEPVPGFNLGIEQDATDPCVIRVCNSDDFGESGPTKVGFNHVNTCTGETTFFDFTATATAAGVSAPFLCNDITFNPSDGMVYATDTYSGGTGGSMIMKFDEASSDMSVAFKAPDFCFANGIDHTETGALLFSCSMGNFVEGSQSPTPLMRLVDGEAAPIALTFEGKPADAATMIPAPDGMHYDEENGILFIVNTQCFGCGAYEKTLVALVSTDDFVTAEIVMSWDINQCDATATAQGSVPATAAVVPGGHVKVLCSNLGFLGAEGVDGAVPATVVVIPDAIAAVKASMHAADSTTWYKKGDTSKTCAWVAEFSKRCSVKGEDGTLASEACPDSCPMVDAAGNAHYANMIKSAATKSLYDWEFGNEAWAASGTSDVTFEITFGGQPFFKGTGANVIWGGLRMGSVSTLPINFPTCKFDGSGPAGTADPNTGYDPLCEFNYAIINGAPMVDTSCYGKGCTKIYTDMYNINQERTYHGKVSFYYTGVTKAAMDAGEGCGTSVCAWGAGETMQLAFYDFYFDKDGKIPYYYQNIIWSVAF